jgi:hypothetical protein
VGNKTKENEDKFANEFLDESKVLTEIKVSEDGGERWHRRNICMVAGLDASGLNVGDVFQFNGEKYQVIMGEDGLVAEPVKIPVSEKKSSRRK